jgi:phage/plasmid-like protein (TIGR03299 family)
MSAEVESMFYHNEVPWHGMGTRVEDLLTADEAIVTAGLDWKVEPVAIFHNYKSNRVKIEEKVALRRDTDGHVLSVLSPQYKPVQNVEAFRFFDDVVGTGEAKYETAGSLRGGKKVWILAKMIESLNIKGDQVDEYLLLMNSHDGSVALKMFFTPVRVVCMNTLNVAQAGAKSTETFYAKHTGNIMVRMEKAREILGMTKKFYGEFAEVAEHLARIQLPPAQLPKLLAAAYLGKDYVTVNTMPELADVSTKQQFGVFEHIQALFEGEGKGLDRPEIKGTKWAAYNAIVEHEDYGREYRGNNVKNNRLDYVWAHAPKIKNRALKFLTEDNS